MLIVNPLVSVVIPTYGRPDKIENSIESILGQTYHNVEIIIVDDNGKGSDYAKLTEEKIKKYIDNHKIIYLACDKNGGGAKARNAGIEYAHGDYITFLDDDDIYLPEKIQMQLNHLIAENCDISICDMFFYDNGVDVESNVCSAKVGTLADFITEGNTFTPMIFSKKSCLEIVGGFHDTPKFQDHLLMIKLLAYGFNIKILRQKLFIHNHHYGERITLTKRFCEGYKEKIKFEVKYLNKLNEKQKKHVLFRIYMVNSRIYAHEKSWWKGALFWIKAVVYIRTFKETTLHFKTLIRNIIFPHRGF